MALVLANADGGHEQGQDIEHDMVMVEPAHDPDQKLALLTVDGAKLLVVALA